MPGLANNVTQNIETGIPTETVGTINLTILNTEMRTN